MRRPAWDACSKLDAAEGPTCVIPPTPQAGRSSVNKALAEVDLHPDGIVGISIEAITVALIAGHAHDGGWAMPDQDDLDATSKAWTYAVLDAVEAADEKTRLEIARILCPAGFVIVPTESVRPPKEQKTKIGQRTQTTGVPTRDAKCHSDQVVNSWMPGRGRRGS
jgi:hypothetical protein